MNPRRSHPADSRIVVAAEVPEAAARNFGRTEEVAGRTVVAAGPDNTHPEAVVVRRCSSWQLDLVAPLRRRECPIRGVKRGVRRTKENKHKSTE